MGWVRRETSSLLVFFFLFGMLLEETEKIISLKIGL